jgi:hypothetical protein
MILDFEIVMRQNIIRTSQTNNLEINIDKFKPFGGLLNRTNDETEMKTIRGSIFIVPIESSERIKIDIDESSE